jgi:hypothetical protein
MKAYYKIFLFPILLLFLSSCHREPKRAQGIYLSQKELVSVESHPNPKSPPLFPWSAQERELPPITKEFFRCKGSSTKRELQREGRSPVKLIDCEGGLVHSLPLKGEKEFIYPPLLSILNFLQVETGKKVIVTTGHRCPTHNRFCDASSYNWNSKHMVGAEVDFYLDGMEQKPLEVIQLIQNYYSAYPDSFRTFKRFGAASLDISTDGWYNDEIFVKLYLKNEGRDQDNLHPYPYVSIQVRSFEGEKVTYTESQANNYLRD